MNRIRKIVTGFMTQYFTEEDGVVTFLGQDFEYDDSNFIYENDTDGFEGVLGIAPKGCSAPFEMPVNVYVVTHTGTASIVLKTFYNMSDADKFVNDSLSDFRLVSDDGTIKTYKNSESQLVRIITQEIRY